jgi:hypothetical protein
MADRIVQALHYMKSQQKTPFAPRTPHSGSGGNGGLGV